MRDIKFRGKDPQTNIWKYGGVYIKNRNKKTLEAFILQYDRRENLTEMYKVIPETVGEFTGIRDIKGEYVFEDDEVVFGNSDLVMIVKYDSDEGCFYCETDDGEYGHPLEKDKCEIVNNIHDRVDDV